ncbi:Protein unc-50-like protein [Bienertia sinuspersici]
MARFWGLYSRVLDYLYLLKMLKAPIFTGFLTNNYLREEAPNSYVVEQRVEWLYAFDVHCNSFFPLFVLLYVILSGFNPSRYVMNMYFSTRL